MKSCAEKKKAIKQVVTLILDMSEFMIYKISVAEKFKFFITKIYPYSIVEFEDKSHFNCKYSAELHAFQRNDVKTPSLCVLFPWF